jgi:hypothetical protein
MGLFNKLKKCTILFAVLMLIPLFYEIGFAQTDAQIYSMAVKAAQSGELDFSFMHFRSLLRNTRNSKYKERALFAIGEYFYLNAGYSDAASAFEQFISDYPNSRGYIFALAYLFKIAKIRGDAPLVKNLEKKILTHKQQSFLFSNFKEYKYNSPFCRKHRAVYYIDRIEFYVDGEFFAKISY